MRALAITLVVAAHALLVFGTSVVAGPGAQPLGALPGGVAMYLPPEAFRALLPNLIYVFHMPLFAFLSGYVLSGREGPGPVRLVAKRSLALAVPYLAWLVVSFFYAGARGSLPAYIGAALLDPSSPGGLWFLYALLECFLFFAAFRWLPGWRYWLVAATGLFTIAVVQRPYSTFLGLGYVSWILPFFVMGFFVARNASRINARRIRGLWAAALIALLTVPIAWPVLGGLPRWWAGTVSSYYAAHPGTHGEFLISVLGGPVARYVSAAACVMLCYYLYGLLPGRLLTAQQALGRRSLGIYATHGFVLWGLYWVGVRWWFVGAVGALAISCCLTWALEHNPILARLLLGQRRQAGAEARGRSSGSGRTRS